MDNVTVGRVLFSNATHTGIPCPVTCSTATCRCAAKDKRIAELEAEVAALSARATNMDAWDLRLFPACGHFAPNSSIGSDRKCPVCAEVAELRKDRARLDWVIQHSGATIMDRGNGQWAVYFGSQPNTPWCDSPRAAIDAAMG